MAIYRCEVKVIGRADGKTATGSASYRSADRIVDERTGVVHDFRNKAGCDDSRILLPDGAPAWMLDRSALWNSVEKSENRKDAQLAREVLLSIPRELNRDQMLALVDGYARDQFVKLGMVADINFHKLDSDNPHAHIMLSMRNITEGDWGKKNRDWNDRSKVEDWRKAWEVHANRSLENAGHDVRIDHRSLLDRKRPATPPMN